MGFFKNIRHTAAVTVCAAAMSVGLATASHASTTHTAAYPMVQYGQVYSSTTGRYGQVATDDGGYLWFFTGSGGAGKPLDQQGAVYSYTTKLWANVNTTDGGLCWMYQSNNNPPPFCPTS